MSYTIDIYRRRFSATDNIIDFFLFVAFFPQLVAGPIVKASEFLPQLNQLKSFNKHFIAEGLMLFASGFTKKVLFADSIAKYIDPIFLDPIHHSSLDCLLAVYGFAFQIFLDFSGYTDMARGLAKMLGFELPVNFNLPYISRSFREFWQRWHISLSSWLRDYLYILLGGNRNGAVRTGIAVLTTMALGGLWHGANWNFVIWGGFHGICLVIERLLGLTTDIKDKPSFTLTNLVRVTIVFHCVCFGWILFRTENIKTAISVIHRIFVGDSSLNTDQVVLICTLLALALWQFIAASTVILKQRFPFIQSSILIIRSIAAGLLLPLALMYSTRSEPFLYFQF